MVPNVSSIRAFRPGLAAVATAVALCVGLTFAPAGHSQAPAAATTSNAALNALLAKLKTQQDQVVANQTKIEAQTALLKEEIRQVKLYSARGGSGHR